jgi:penicillin-insensitive murein endopeptidase
MGQFCRAIRCGALTVLLASAPLSALAATSEKGAAPTSAASKDSSSEPKEKGSAAAKAAESDGRDSKPSEPPKSDAKPNEVKPDGPKPTADNEAEKSTAPSGAKPDSKSASTAPAASLKKKPEAADRKKANPEGGVSSAATKPAAPKKRPVLTREELATYGPLSVGHPHAGFQLNAVRMPKAPHWELTVPGHAYGTRETVDALSLCIPKVGEQFPGTPPVMIGSISAEKGGHLPPHKSHRTGRDVDIYFYRVPGAKWFKAATEDDIDYPRTWALLRCLVTETDIDFVLIDQKPRAWFEAYARSIGEDPQWITDLFEGSGRYPYSLIKHVPGHVAHMHVRFVSPEARRRGVQLYDKLVEAGLIDSPEKEVKHSVVRGDTLIGLSKKYKLSVDQIQKLNDLSTTTIRVGQVLKMRERVDVRGARDAVWVPPRRLPEKTREAVRETMAQLAEVQDRYARALGKK